MPNRRNWTPAERALQLICAMAEVSFEEYQSLLDKSQEATRKAANEGGYDIVKGMCKDFRKHMGEDAESLRALKELMRALVDQAKTPKCFGRNP